MIKKFDQNLEIKQEIENIFWMTMSQIPEESEKRKKLKYKYFDRYFENDEPIFYYEKEGKVLGYILGSLQTNDPFYKESFPYYCSLESLLRSYPAHLHINCHKDSQGLGIGSMLLVHFENYCQSFGVKGVHLITLFGDRNVQFYLKNNYQNLTQIEFNGVSLLFLGKKT